MLLGARQFFERRGAPTPPLPYDAEVEYLESPADNDGNSIGCYIDLGVNSTTDRFCNFDIRFRNIKSALANPPFGYQYAASARYGIWGDSTRSIGANNANSATGYSYDTNWHTVSMRNGSHVDYDGVQTAIGTGTVRANIGLILFGIVTSSSGNSLRALVAAQISSFTLYNTDGEKIRDMIPVRKDGAGYMYDKVSGNLLGNGGTGDFVIGPDKL